MHHREYTPIEIYDILIHTVKNVFIAIGTQNKFAVYYDNQTAIWKIQLIRRRPSVLQVVKSYY